MQSRLPPQSCLKYYTIFWLWYIDSFSVYMYYTVCLAASLSNFLVTVCTAVALYLYLISLYLLYRKMYLLLAVTVTGSFKCSASSICRGKCFLGANWPVALIVQLSFNWT